MAGFDFGQIGDIVSSVMDTDYIDISRDINGEVQELYSNVLCHVAYVSFDNPDPTTVDIKPIIQGLMVHMPLWVDIQNNDFIVAKKIGSTGKLIAVYSGRCGNPVVSQGRKKVNVLMTGTEPYEPTPIPTENTVPVTVYCTYNDENIKNVTVEEVEIGSEFVLIPPVIIGYESEECYINEVKQDTVIATIPEVGDEPYVIEFVYKVSEQSDSYRYLVNGLYTKDDGGLANGWHLYTPITIDSIEKNGDTYTVTSDNIIFIHDDNGKRLAIGVGTQIVLMPEKTFAQVTSYEVSGNKVTFVCEKFEPTEAQENAYVTNWY